jgi:hypothetical protein
MDKWGQGTFTLSVSRLYRRAIRIADETYAFIAPCFPGWSLGVSLRIVPIEELFHTI